MIISVTNLLSFVLLFFSVKCKLKENCRIPGAGSPEKSLTKLFFQPVSFK